jgi:hypothetical protein
MKRTFAIAVLFLTVSGVALFVARNVTAAQRKGGPTGVISGLVLGPDDKPAPHAAITYQSSDGSAPHAVHADSRGRFTISKLHTDIYDIRATAGGIFSEWQKNFQVQSGHTSEITLHLIYAKEMPKSAAAKPRKKN